MGNMFKRSITSKGEYERKELDSKFQNELENLKLSLSLLKDERINLIKVPKNNDENNISIQLLMFHYLGFLQIEQLTNKNKSVLLSALFGTEGTENIRRFLSNVGGKTSPLMKQKYLVNIEDLFKSVGLKEPLKKVQADLKRLFPESVE